MKIYQITITDKETGDTITRNYADRLFTIASREQVGDEIVDMYNAIIDREVKF